MSGWYDLYFSIISKAPAALDSNAYLMTNTKSISRLVSWSNTFTRFSRSPTLAYTSAVFGWDTMKPYPCWHRVPVRIHWELSWDLPCLCTRIPHICHPGSRRTLVHPSVYVLYPRWTGILQRGYILGVNTRIPIWCISSSPGMDSWSWLPCRWLLRLEPSL